MSEAVELGKSNQEQAVAAWVNYLNQLRLDSLLSTLDQQDMNLADALASVTAAVRKIDLEVVTTNRGGVKGMHGFIAEVAEVGVGNARRQVSGENPLYQWVNDNGPVDLMRSGVAIQQKFFAAGNRFGLGAIADHLQKYPDFVENGGKYQIPRDHFEVIQKLHAMPREEAGKLLTRTGDGPSYGDWTRVQSFFEGGSLGVESLEPSHLKYSEVQMGAYGATLESETDSSAPPISPCVTTPTKQASRRYGGHEGHTCGRRHRRRDRTRAGRDRETPCRQAAQRLHTRGLDRHRRRRRSRCHPRRCPRTQHLLAHELLRHPRRRCQLDRHRCFRRRGAGEQTSSR